MKGLVFGISWLAFTALPLNAQDTRTLPSELRDGRRALSFGAFVGGGGTIGATFMLTPRTAFTLDLQADANISSSDGSGSTTAVERENFGVEALLAPGLRRYVAGRGNVASYVAGRVLFGFTGAISENRFGTSVSRIERWSPMVGGAVGFGLEWFVTDAMSLRGEAAVQATYRRTTDTGPDPSGTEEYTSHMVRAGLGQSGLAISIWF